MVFQRVLPVLAIGAMSMAALLATGCKTDESFSESLSDPMAPGGQQETLAPAPLRASQTPQCREKNWADSRATRNRGGARPGLDYALTPSFFSDMTACPYAIDRVAVPPEGGRLNANGDCQIGPVLCHYHSQGNEFGNRGQAEGEVHCIYPQEGDGHARVFGFRFVCEAGTRPVAWNEMNVHHEAAVGGSCGENMLGVMSQCEGRAYCCSDGNLTNPWPAQNEAQRAVRPHFTICEDIKRIDCGAGGPLHDMLPHATNPGTELLQDANGNSNINGNAAH